MMEDSDILTLGWGCDTLAGVAGNPGIWPPQGEEFVTLEVRGGAFVLFYKSKTHPLDMRQSFSRYIFTLHLKGQFILRKTPEPPLVGGGGK